MSVALTLGNGLNAGIPERWQVDPCRQVFPDMHIGSI
jgi:hypothetical protein